VNDSPPITHLIAVERWTLALGALLIGVGLLMLPPRSQLGISLGAGLMMLNTWMMRRLSDRLLCTFAAGRPSIGLLLLLFNVKLLLIGALLFLIIRHLPVDPLSLILGVSILPVAILLRAVQYGLNPDSRPAAHRGES
jgi:hypothetical protein